MGLVLYLVVWIPVAALLTAILSATDRSGWWQSAVIVFPLCFLYAFVCQSSWYMCRAIPLREREIVGLIGTHTAAAVVSSGLWVGVAEVWTLLLGVTVAQAPILFFSSGVVLFLLAVAFNYLLITFEASQLAEKKALELQVLARESELKALRAQIDPHFLFNSLNSINALVMTDPAGARRMCVLLADFLRGCLKFGSEQRISLSEEMKLADHYLDIERVRLGSRLVIERKIDPACQACLVPPLIMQPLVENAITHGVAPLLEGGTVRIEAQRYGDVLRIVLENPFESEAVKRNGTGVGLKNVRMRLMNLFNGDARFDVQETAGRFRVELQLPCEER